MKNGPCPVDSFEFGMHNRHINAPITQRHTCVVNSVAKLVRRLPEENGHKYIVDKEVPVSMLSAEGITLKASQSSADSIDIRPDIVIINKGTNYRKLLDVSITHPNGLDQRTWDQPQFALLRAEKKKFKHYDKHLVAGDFEVIPLIFDSFGGYSEKTFDHLNNWVHSVTRDDKGMHSAVMRSLRDEIAVAIHSAAFHFVTKISMFHNLNIAGHALAAPSHLDIKSNSALLPSAWGGPVGPADD